MTLALLVLATLTPQFAAGGDFLTIDRGSGPENIYVKAINLGSGSPGHFPGEHAIDEETYRRWFEQMSAAGFNAVRVFDLQAPRMYRALLEHNKRHVERPLYLLQGVWLAAAATEDLYLQSATFDKHLAEAVDAVHGRAQLPRQRGRAHGGYAADVSPWLLGWIIGRELEPSVVEATDRAHPTVTSYSGKFVSLAAGTPTEAWAAGRFEHLARVETDRFGATRPIALVMWPPLDPLHHVSATHRRHAKARPGLDDVAIDGTRIRATARSAGLFAAYSVYPYYPEFIWREPLHRRMRDGQGANPYLGYLERLKRHYSDRPLLIAEYGVPSSGALIAREPTTRMHLGGLGEVKQGKALARMTANIAAARCAGGAVFSWMDEWWKPSWIVRGLSASERRPLWHDVLSPEEHFGLVGFDVARPKPATVAVARGRLRRIALAARHDGLVLRLELVPPLSAGETLHIGLDTIDEGQERDEFRLVVVDGKAQLYVADDYRPVRDAKTPRQVAGWVPWTWITRAATRDDNGSLRPAVTENVGKLKARVSHAVEVDLPWTLLRFTDPSRGVVLGRDASSTATSPGVAVTAALAGETLEGSRYVWKPWSRAPVVRERAKPALVAIRRALALLPDKPRVRRASAATKPPSRVADVGR